MTTVRRILDAVTIRQVFIALVIGAFAKEIMTFVTWLTAMGHGLAGVSSVRGLLVAALSLALNAAFVYLALRGLGWVLKQRRRTSPIAADAAEGQGQPSAGMSDDSTAAGPEAASWPREGGGNGHGPDRY